jgi:hypothetical protein
MVRQTRFGLNFKAVDAGALMDCICVGNFRHIGAGTSGRRECWDASAAFG